jgi:hypothetical protein
LRLQGQVNDFEWWNDQGTDFLDLRLCHRLRKMKALLVRIGADQACGGWNAPVDAEGRFV